jgi:hypothetical protein
VADCEVEEGHGLKLINLSHLQLIFLPANVTSRAQPLDQGIIACIKAHYRRFEPFSGSKDPNGLTIDREFFLPLLHWLKGSVMQLRASQLPEQYWVSTLLSALRGAAKKAFTRIYGDEPIHTWSLEKFHVSIARLVPDHETQFTETGFPCKVAM